MQFRWNGWIMVGSHLSDSAFIVNIWKVISCCSLAPPSQHQDGGARGVRAHEKARVMRCLPLTPKLCRRLRKIPAAPSTVIVTGKLISQQKTFKVGTKSLN